MELCHPSIFDLYLTKRYDHDICVMSPTGTGKTLAYAIPIVKRLHKRVIPRIRGLIIVPSASLVSQVKAVFDTLITKTDITICSIGVKTIKDEQAVFNNQFNNIDIIIATPGRLQTHIDSTENFTLQHLEFLVLDEADLLLVNYAPWIISIFSIIYNNQHAFINIPSTAKTGSKSHIDITTSRISHTHPKAFENSPPLRRWLFSATLTEQSPSLAQLHLQSPVFFTSQASSKKYRFPENLQQYYICVEGNMRGVALIKLIDEIMESNTDARIVCFATSINACHRIFSLLKLMRQKLSVVEFYGSMQKDERTSVLSNFEQGRSNVVVCSDLMARGIDVPIDVVINYDIPEQIKAYIHRVGRTARGFSNGLAYSIIDPAEKDDFLGMVQKGENLKLAEMIYDSFSIDLLTQFKAVLQPLQTMMQLKSTGRK